MCNAIGNHLQKVTSKSPLGWHLRKQDQILSRFNQKLGLMPIRNFGNEWVNGVKRANGYGDGEKATKKVKSLEQAAPPPVSFTGLGKVGK